MLNSDPPAEAHYEGLYRFAYSLSKCESDASDLVQQTFLAWVKHRERILDHSKVKSWLFTTLYREFLRGLRKQKRMKYLEEDELEMAMPAVTEHAGRRMDGAMAMEALQNIPDPYRAALSLFYIQDFSYLEIAEVLKVSPGTVMSRIYRGKQMLKKQVEQWERIEEPQNKQLHVLRRAHGS